MAKLTKIKRTGIGHKIQPPGPCKWPEGCGQISGTRRDGMSLGYCVNHWAQMAKSGWRNRRANIAEGTERISSNGYPQTFTGGHWRYTHDLVGEAILGRLLEPHESIGHLVGITDNSPENLALVVKIPLDSPQLATMAENSLALAT